MAYYAMAHSYGATACDGKGNHIGTVHRFHSAHARDHWVSQGPDYLSEPGHRTALVYANATDRRSIEYALALGDGYIEEHE